MSESQPNLQDLMVQAFREAKDQAREVTRTIRTSVVTRPADPNAEPLKGQEYIDEYLRFVMGPELESRSLELREKYKIPDGMVSRRIVDYVVDGQKKLRAAEKGR